MIGPCIVWGCSRPAYGPDGWCAEHAPDTCAAHGQYAPDCSGCDAWGAMQDPAMIQSAQDLAWLLTEGYTLAEVAAVLSV